jgi:hypothetical protein
MEDTIEWIKIRMEYMLPVITVLLFASLLVFFTYLADVSVKAVVVAEEGGSEQQASAGILNALIYIIPAVIGGFIIALLFKYRKKFTLRAFFGSAIFFATAFISFFFFEIILFVLQLKSYGLIMLSPSSFISTSSQPYLFYYSEVQLFIVPISIAMGLSVAYIISSRRFIIYTKNSALLFLGGLMGAFLAVILPTWTVIFMLVGLSVYDIYSVRRGPIREIMELTYGPASENPPPPPKTSSTAPPPKTTKGSDTGTNDSTGASKPINNSDVPQGSSTPVKVISTQQVQRMDDPGDDDLLSSMTYGTAHWDLGIGDLVFYSMLGSHTLMFGTQFIPEYGLIAPIGLFLITTIGIILGFIITLKLLERNAMLPGLPMSISLGLIAFIIGVGVLYLV